MIGQADLRLKSLHGSMVQGRCILQQDFCCDQSRLSLLFLYDRSWETVYILIMTARICVGSKPLQPESMIRGKWPISKEFPRYRKLPESKSK